jgi:hypothetical protein
LCGAGHILLRKVGLSAVGAAVRSASAGVGTDAGMRVGAAGVPITVLAGKMLLVLIVMGGDRARAVRGGVKLA